jgi:hypothetical protein
MSKSPEGEWYININGVRYEGKIWAVDSMPINCGVSIWTLRTWDNVGTAQIDISAPRTRFRKVKND